MKTKSSKRTPGAFIRVINDIPYLIFCKNYRILIILDLQATLKEKRLQIDLNHILKKRFNKHKLLTEKLNLNHGWQLMIPTGPRETCLMNDFFFFSFKINYTT